MLLYSHPLPHRLRARPSTTSETFRQWGSQHAGPPRVAPHHRRRGHDRAPRPGLRQRRRHRLAERNLRGRFGADVVDHHTFVICGDGDLEEGISHEAASLAGHLGLGRLVVRLRRQPHHHRRPDRAGATPTTSPSASRATAGTSIELGEVANDLDALEAGLRAGMAEDERAEPRRAAQPHRLPVAEVHRHRQGARQPARRRRGRARSRRSSACPPRDFFVPDDVLAFYRDAGVRGAARARSGSSAWPRPRMREPEPPRSSTPASSGARPHRLGGEAARRGRPARRLATRSACARGRSTRSSTSCPA